MRFRNSVVCIIVMNALQPNDMLSSNYSSQWMPFGSLSSNEIDQMRVIMLRHSTRKREDDRDPDGYMDRSLTLDAVGEREARTLASDLAGRAVNPAVYFTSCFEHARQTGEILRDALALAPPAKIVQLCTLTPHYQGPRKWRGSWSGVRMLESIAQEARLSGNDLRELDTAAFVLHQPRLQQLLAAMTSQVESLFSTIRYSEGVCVGAESVDALLEGKGKVEWRLTRQ